MLIADLRDLSYNKYMIKHGSTKTKDILKMIDHKYNGNSDMIGDLFSMEINNTICETLTKTAIKNIKITTLRECGEIAFLNETQDKAKQIGLSSSDELFDPFLNLEVESKLFEMFGDIDTSWNLRQQQLMVCSIVNNVPIIVYWWSHEDCCDLCKKMHDSLIPWVKEYIVLFRNKIVHPNCDCELREDFPTPFHYLPSKHPYKKERTNSGGDFLKNLFNTIFGTTSDVIHTALDILGFIPVVGAIADGINAVYYLAESDYINATLSGVSAIPIVGYIGGGIKVVSTGAKIVDNAGDAIKIVDKVNDAMKVADIIKEVTKAIDKTGDISKYIDKIVDTSKFVDKASDYAKVVDKISDTVKKVDKTSDLSKVTSEILQQLENVDKVSNTTNAINKIKDVQKVIKATDIANGLNKLLETKKIIEKSTQIGGVADKVNDILKTTSKIENVISGVNKASDLAKNFNMIADTTKVFDKVSDNIKTVDKLSNSTNIIDKISDTSKAIDKVSDVSQSVDKVSDISKNFDKTNDSLKHIDNLLNTSKNDITKQVERPTWKQSEIDVGRSNPEFTSQKSFKNGESVPYKSKGSSRPDLFKDGYSIEVKNYNIENYQNRKNMLNTLNNQFDTRKKNLPNQTKQFVEIDIRGQNISDDILKDIIEHLEKYDKVRFIR